MKLMLAAVGLVGILTLNLPSLDSFRVDAQRFEINPKEKIGKQSIAAPAVSVSITALGVAVTEDFDTLSNTAGSTNE